MIKGTKNWGKIDKFVKELDRRVEQVKRHTVLTVTKKAFEVVQDKAPTNDPQLGNYTENLSVKMIQGKGARYGILHSGKPEKTTDLNPKKVLLYLKEIKLEKENRTNQVYRILRKYEPFAIGMWPPGVPKDDLYVVYRHRKENDVLAQRFKNEQEVDKVIRDLAKVGVRVSKSDYPKNTSVDAVHDITHTVLGKELGLLQKPKPHWRPAIRAAKRADALILIKKDARMLRALNDPDFKGWESLGRINQSVSEGAIKEIKKFQKIIVG